MLSLQQIFDETGSEMEGLQAQRKPEDQKRRSENQVVQNKMIDHINAILRDDQKPLYQQYRAEREAERESGTQASPARGRQPQITTRH